MRIAEDTQKQIWVKSGEILSQWLDTDSIANDLISFPPLYGKWRVAVYKLLTEITTEFYEWYEGENDEKFLKEIVGGNIEKLPLTNA